MQVLERLWRQAHAGFAFYILRFFEPLYSLGFAFAQWRAKKQKKYRASCPVISIGNLSVGGTGKSVVVRYLCDILPKNHAILLRGYRSTSSHSKRSKLVSDGKQTYCNVHTAGDEAIMLVEQTKATVAVGRNRAESCRLLEQKRLSPAVIILDDAYQHHTVHKDIEILLLDARWPFENGHCIPAGRLREKDCTRARVIILTHAELLSAAQQASVRTQVVHALAKQGAEVPVLLGCHVAKTTEQLPQKVFAIAGIGSFDQFVASVKKQGAQVVGRYNAGDHAQYNKKLLQRLDFKDAQAIVTTAKDMVKLREFKDQLGLPVHVLDITFAFVSTEETEVFNRLVNI